MKEITSAGAIIIKDNKILLCKRSKNERLYPGFWECPGGKSESRLFTYNK